MNKSDESLHLEDRKLELRRLGLRAYQVVLNVGVLVFVSSVLVHWSYRVVLGYHDVILLTMLIRPTLIVFL